METKTIQDILVEHGYEKVQIGGLKYLRYVRKDKSGRIDKNDKFILFADGKKCFKPPYARYYTAETLVEYFNNKK